MKAFRGLLVFAVFLLAGCQTVLMSPSGDLAIQQRNLIITSTVLMLLIIVPVIALTLIFAWHFRASNKKATYDPDWDHSTILELLIWSAPLLIIIALGAITWVSTHKLDPYRPLDRVAANRPMPSDVRPLQVNVVALDWKWLFIYPEQGIATVNELAAPVDRPIQFKITSSTVMNSFFIPALAGQIYAMPGMETQLQAVINKPGEFQGFSANYSGQGFSGMHFLFHGLSEEDFAQWVQKTKSGGSDLSRDAYVKLAQPSENDAVKYYATVEPGLYRAILTHCVDPENPSCMTRMDLSPHESGDSGTMTGAGQTNGMAAMADHSHSD
ncbi:ubiquinol oxidase subunit II [Dyella telluris]|uniref:Ubiquinol oxidase subunit 2 n=1 Tax=Dyella telluris TaxID=2763498 RepID=A0A7G8Q976_9GAMM|nr:ubiquinol oxidase subunit II [Dyella telluris]QNK03334.1 ubiquinol oxidase subunit II [Dyella telluris]